MGGRRGCSRRGTFVHALFCSTALVTFVSKYSDFFTYDATRNLLAGICSHEWKRVAGGGGGAIAARGVAFHMPWGGGGGGS